MLGTGLSFLCLEQLLCDTIEDAGGFLSVTFQRKLVFGLLLKWEIYTGYTSFNNTMAGPVGAA